MGGSGGAGGEVPFVPEPVIGDGSGGSPDVDCPELKSRLAPPQSVAWCRSNFSPQQRAFGAAREFILSLAQSSQFGPESGLGRLQEFLRHPDSRLAASGRPSAEDQILALVGGALLAAQPGDHPDWSSVAARIASACLTVEYAATGREISPYALRESTERCLTSAAILRMEANGTSFNPDADRTWLDGIAVGPGVASVDLGTLLSRLLGAAGFRDGLKANASLLAVNDFVDKRLKRCDEFIGEMKRAGCSVP